MATESGATGGTPGSSDALKKSIRVVDRSGRELRRIVKDQQVYVEVTRPGKVDPADPPKPIEVTFSKAGSSSTDELSVAYFADPRQPNTVFWSEPLSIAGGGQGGDTTSLGGFTWKTGDFDGMSTKDGQQVSVQGPDGSSATVQVFTSSASLMHQEYTDAATQHRNTGRSGAANLEQALTRLAEVRQSPDIDPAKADKLEAEIRSRLNQVKRTVCAAERALAYLENDRYLLHQQNAAAAFYLRGARAGIDPNRQDPNGVTNAIQNATDAVTNIVHDSANRLVTDLYKGFTNATGTAQLKTLLTGVDEMGKEVGWDKRVVAFLDLTANGMMFGAGMLKTVRDLSSKTRMGGPGRAGRLDDGSVPQRYKGNDLEQAPSGTIVDPTQLGYSPKGIAAAHQIARKHDVIIQSRPTGAMAPWWKQEHGAIPKAEKFKAKTVKPVDQRLGADPSMPPGRVALFDPKPDVFTEKLRRAGKSDAEIQTSLDQLHEAGLSGGKVRPKVPDNPPGSGMTDSQWVNTVERYSQRHGEWHGSTGQAMRKMEAAGEIEIGPGGIVTVDGKFVVGDYDPWDILHRNGSPVSMEKHLAVIGDLRRNGFQAQHPAHMRWDPQRSDFPEGAFGDAKFRDARGIYEKIIEGHASRVTGGVQQGEILLNFSPEGPPIALYSGQKPAGRWFGDMPLDYGEIVPGSGWTLPAQWGWYGTSVVTQAVRHDEDAVPFAQSLAEIIGELEPCHECIETPLVVTPGATTSRVPKLVAGAAAIIIVGVGSFVFTRGGSDPEPSVAVPDPIVVDDSIPDDAGDRVGVIDEDADDVVEQPAAPVIPTCGSEEELVDGECRSTAPLVPLLEIQLLTTELPPGDVWDCVGGAYVRPAAEGPLVRVDLLLGPASPSGEVPLIGLFSGGVAGPAVGEAWMFDNGLQFGFSSRGAESFCNFGVEPLQDNLVSCGGSFLMSGMVPIHPQTAGDFGTSFYTPNIADPSLLTSYSGSHSASGFEDRVIQVDAGGQVLIGDDESTLAVPGDLPIGGCDPDVLAGAISDTLGAWATTP